MKLIAIAAACICAFATSSFANSEKIETLAELAALGEDDIVAGLMAAVGDAYGWANTDLAAHRLPPLFCAPEKLAISNQQYVLMFSRYLEENPQIKDRDFHLYPYVLLKALKEAFPCK